MKRTSLSALVVARDEEARISGCLETLGFADEIVVVLDRCQDGTKDIAEKLGARILEGAWEIEGPRRNAGIEACAGDWIVEVDADERVPGELADEIRQAIASAEPGYFLIPFDNFIGPRLVRHGWGGSWGVNSTARLFARGAKHWGDQRIHPTTRLTGKPRRLRNRMIHHVDRDVSDMLRRLDRYTTMRARDLRDSGDIGSLASNLRRLFSRFFKCFIMRKGYREGIHGFLIALFAGLYPLLSHIKARIQED